MMSEWSPVKPVTPDLKRICTEVKSQIQVMAGADFAVYIPVDFISKEEAGGNSIYVVKVEVGGNNCVHAKIFQSGGGDLNVEAVQYPKPHNEPLVPF